MARKEKETRSTDRRRGREDKKRALEKRKRREGVSRAGEREKRIGEEGERDEGRKEGG